MYITGGFSENNQMTLNHQKRVDVNKNRRVTSCFGDVRIVFFFRMTYYDMSTLSDSG